MKTQILHPAVPLPWGRAIHLISLLLLFWLTSWLGHADTHTWDGSTSGYWGTGANWNTGTVPQDGDDLVFPAGPTRLATTNNTSTTRRYNSIRITGANYALRGNSLTLSNGITATYGAGATAWVELDLTLAQGQTIECTTDNSILYVTGDIALGASTLVADATGNMLFGGAISGTGGLAKYGDGYLRLYGSTANTYNGITRVNVGTLEFNKTSGVNAMGGNLVVGNNTGDPETARWLNSAQLPSTTDVTVNHLALLDLNDFNEALGGLTLNAGRVQTGAGLLTLGGDVTARPVVGVGRSWITGRLSLGAGTRTFTVPLVSGASWPGLEIDAEVSGSGGLTKSGDGGLGLRGVNTYNGLTTVAEGQLAVLSDAALGSTTAGTVVQAGARLEVAAIYATSVHVGNEALTLYGHLYAGGVGFTTSNSWTGPITLGTNVIVAVGTNEFLNLSGTVVGSGGIDKKWGAGTLILSGSGANSFTGDVEVKEGILLLDKSVTDGAIPGPGALIIGDGTGGVAADVVRELRDYQIDSSVDITVNQSGILDLAGQNDTVGALNLLSGYIVTGTGTLTLAGDVTATSVTNYFAVIAGHLVANASTQTFNLTAGYYSPDLYIPAQISGSANLAVIGDGGLMLAASNSFSGTLTVEDYALLWPHHAWALGTTNGGTVINGDARLGFDGGEHILAEPLTMNSAYPLGAFWVEDGSNSWSGPITLSRDVTVDFFSDRNPSLNLVGPISGSGGLNMKNAGTLVLSGTTGNTYTGDTHVEAGTLLLGKNAGSGVAIRYGTLFIGDGEGGANADRVRFVAGNQLWSTVPIIITNSGVLDLNGYSDTVGPLTIAGGRATSGTGGLLYLGGTVTSLGAASGCSALEGNVYLSGTRTFDVANSSCSPDLNVTAAISGTGGITKIGAGALGLYASNSFSGVLTVNDGLVYLYNDTAPGSTAGATVVNDGGVLVLANNRAIGAEPLTLNGNGDGTSGALASIGGSNSWAGTVTLATDSVITVQTNRYLNLAGVVAGPAGFINGQPGTLILSGTDANTFAGNTVVNEGTLLLDKTGVDGALPGPGELIIGDNVGGRYADVVCELRSYQIDGSVDITVNDSGLLDLNDQSDSIGALSFYSGHVDTGTGTLTLGGDVTVSRTSTSHYASSIRGRLSLGSNTRTFDISDSIPGHPGVAQLSALAVISGTGGITKTGRGILYLYEANTYTGPTTISYGFVDVEHDEALGSPAAGTIVEEGGSLLLDGAHVDSEPLTIQGRGCVDLGALLTLESSAYSNSWAGPITLASNAQIAVYGTNLIHLLGPISGPGGFTKIGEGTLLLSGPDANSYAGATEIDEGTLVLDKFGTDGAVPGQLIIGDGMDWAGADVVRLARANQIANTADVSIASSGVFDLNEHYDRINALTGSGSITLGSGHLIAGNSGSSFTFDGLVSGTGYLWKVGAGTWTLTGDNTYSGTTRIEAGTLLVNGSQPASEVLIQSQGTLGGTGAVGRVTSTGGVLSPGVSPGTLTSSNLLFDSASDFVVELGSPASDQLSVRGKVGLGDASLVLSAPGLLPAEGQQFRIVNNDEADAVTGTFSGLPEGARVSAGPRRFHITYKGGDGNDVVLTATNTAALRPELSIWRTATNSVVVAWPLSDIAWLLHTTTNLGATPILWTEIPAPYQTNGAHFQFTEPVPAGNKFFRLHKP